MFKRYMVFTWSEYDNVSPFENVEDSFDDLRNAEDSVKLIGDYADDGTKLFCIFDRVEGVFKT